MYKTCGGVACARPDKRGVTQPINKQHSYRRGTAGRPKLVEVLSTAPQMCEKSHRKRLNCSVFEIERVICRKSQVFSYPRV